VKILDVVPEHRLVFTWGVAEQETRVTIEMETDGPGTTAVTVTEGSWEPDEAGIKSYGGQIQGWTSVLFCLKASLEHDIDLRKGSITRRHRELISAGPASKR